MVIQSNIAICDFTEKQKLLLQIQQLETQNLHLKFLIEDLRAELRMATKRTELESKFYSGIKKYFK